MKRSKVLYTVSEARQGFNKGQLDIAADIRYCSLTSEGGQGRRWSLLPCDLDKIVIRGQGQTLIGKVACKPGLFPSPSPVEPTLPGAPFFPAESPTQRLSYLRRFQVPHPGGNFTKRAKRSKNGAGGGTSLPSKEGPEALPDKRTRSAWDPVGKDAH